MGRKRMDGEIGGPGWLPTVVHPLAEMFPMLAEADLKGLAEDIKQHGLMHPIIIDDDGVLIDGRNRLGACRGGGGEPYYQRCDAGLAEAAIWSANVKRRQMTKGQIAMVAAMGVF